MAKRNKAHQQGDSQQKKKRDSDNHVSRENSKKVRVKSAESLDDRGGANKPKTEARRPSPLSAPQKNGLESVIIDVCSQGIESLGDDGSSALYRLGDSSDVRAIVSLYRKIEQEGEEDDHTDSCERDKSEKGSETTESSSLDESTFIATIANAIGDEDHPASIFPVCCDTKLSEDGDASLSAVALVSNGWDGTDLTLRVEWLGVSPTFDKKELLTRRLWLRLASMALSMSCGLSVSATTKAASLPT